MSFFNKVTNLKTDSGSFSTRVSDNEGNTKSIVKTDVKPTFSGSVQGKLTTGVICKIFCCLCLSQDRTIGSTLFGDDIDDTHRFTGSLFVSGSVGYLLVVYLVLGSYD